MTFQDTLHELAGIHDGQIAALKCRIAALAARNEYLEMIAEDRRRIIEAAYNDNFYYSRITPQTLKQMFHELSPRPETNGGGGGAHRSGTTTENHNGISCPPLASS